MTTNISFADFVRARHGLWLDKTYGIPVTNYVADEVADQLRYFHLTNVWRELDRGTLTVINGIQQFATDTTEAVYHTILYRFFNSDKGYLRLLAIANDPEHPTVDEINSVLDQSGNFSGAYLRTVNRPLAIRALTEAYDHSVVIATEIDRGNGPVKIRKAFGDVPSFGDFLSDQLMLDVSWQGNPWELTFMPGLGPGAKRGLDRMGLDFYQAINEGFNAIADMPVPELDGKPVTFDGVETEHQLCEVEKLWKLQEAVAEDSGRKVKMRNYGNAPRSVAAKPKINALPYNWSKPKF